MIIHNVPLDVTIENLQEIILVQNPELGLVSGTSKPDLRIGLNGDSLKWSSKSAERRERNIYTKN